jgi:diguanylate cyclase (GGDEF)-like protein
MNRAREQIRAWWAPPPDPYAGGDLENARRLGSLFWGVSVLMIAALLPISPPSDAIGDAGWVLAAATLLGAAACTYVLAATERLHSWNALFLAGCASVPALAVLQWLAGGVGTPYEQLLLLPILFVAAVSPPRRIAAFMLLVLAALVSPYIYDGWSADAAGSAAASYLIWWVIAFIASLLMRRVRAERLRLQREGTQAREEARRDSLTGLRNRRAFDETAGLEVERACRLEVPLSLVLLDIENFKAVNDEYGHLEGDRCLREVGAAVRGELRQPDLCFRWGGDEFALVLTGTDAAGARRLVNRLRETVRRSCRRPNGDRVAVRVGIAELARDSRLEELIELADLALTSPQRPAGIEADQQRQAPADELS